VGQFEIVLKGHGFQPCRNCHKINGGFSRWGNVNFKLTHYPTLRALGGKRGSRLS
jgi:hypothetical protein